MYEDVRVREMEVHVKCPADCRGVVIARRSVWIGPIEERCRSTQTADADAIDAKAALHRPFNLAALNGNMIETGRVSGDPKRAMILCSIGTGRPYTQLGERI